MAEPWLDSLSEDWNSEHRSSSPPSRISDKSDRNTSSVKSRSRIPHLQHGLRKESSNSAYLRPRSTKGLAKSKTSPVLSERDPTSLNLRNKQNLKDGRDNQMGAATLPSRVSSGFSESQSSVQHYSLRQSQRKQQVETPEWKKRLAQGENIGGDGIDLFSPSKLEGIFSDLRREAGATKENEPPVEQVRPWSSLDIIVEPSTFEAHATFRSSRGVITPLQAVEEVNEDEPSQFEQVPDIDLHNLGNRQITTSKAVAGHELMQTSFEENKPHTDDSRLRTVSGQEEIRNEDISPVTVSKQNTIRDRAIQQSLQTEVVDFERDLKVGSLEEIRRPSSSSSDPGIQYGQDRQSSRLLSRDESQVEFTTHSLPEDLSMGTQEFVSKGGFVNNRRGGCSDDDSFHQRPLSSNLLSSPPDSRHPSQLRESIRSSPPLHIKKNETGEQQSRLTVSLPTTPSSASVVHHIEASDRPVSGSPLKLFGVRDTYTNNKLLRMLSQFEEGEKRGDEMIEGESHMQSEAEQKLRMSQFGNGDLDAFDFSQAVERDQPQALASVASADRIFQVKDQPQALDITNVVGPSRQSQIPRPVPPRSQDGNLNIDMEDSQRMQDSFHKDRTPKRRRTLLRNEMPIPVQTSTIKIEITADSTKLAGTKHKDSRSDIATAPAHPHILAARAILQPRGTRKVSSAVTPEDHDQVIEIDHTVETPDTESKLTEVLAAELASFANDAHQISSDSRKPSLATKDYMEEANKVMQLIRARGKPKIDLQSVNEPKDVSELNPDAILDLDIDEDSTIEPFSRPPSRDGPYTRPPNPRNIELDPRTVSYLRKFQDPDDLEMITRMSVRGQLSTIKERESGDVSNATVLDDNQESRPPSPNAQEGEFAASRYRQESSPANIRILNHDQLQRKRKHSTSTLEGPNSSGRDIDPINQDSSGSSTRSSFPTGSSNSSGRKLLITSGDIPIPDQVGAMTFDHARKVWIPQQKPEIREAFASLNPRQINREEDPFANIPDLSVNEQQEEAMCTRSPKNKDGQKPASSIGTSSPKTGKPHQNIGKTLSTEKGGTNSAHVPQSNFLSVGKIKDNSLRSQVSDHELKIHDGLPSQAPTASEDEKKQPRVVTISFSSPLISATKYFDDPSLGDEELDDDDDDDDDDELPLDEYGMTASSPAPTRADEWAEEVRIRRSELQYSSRSHRRHDDNRALMLNRRPVSRIDEHDEEDEQNIEMSVVHVPNGGAVSTPARASRHDDSALVPLTGRPKESSIIALTPLSEFSVHQVDNVRHPEQIYIGKRGQPKSLRQAHGPLALAEDDLVRAITDAEQSELFWDHERALNLCGKGLTTLHGLKDYCAVLEVLNVGNNKINQLNGMPTSVRILDIRSNDLSTLTSWGQLQNLQYLNISANHLDSLDGFSSLVHLRELNAAGNHINNIDGVAELDALLTLDLSNNELTALNFDGYDLLRLRKLDLSGNRLTDIRNLHALSALEELNLERNDLKDLSIPDDASMSELQVLNLSNNLFASFDMGPFPNLAELYLDRNSVNSLTGLEASKSLRTLSIREQAESPDILNLVLSQPLECQTLRLSSNILRDGHQLAVSHMPQYNVRELEMSCCGIERLPEGFGDTFPNCRVLNLNFNAIRDLDFLQGMLKLEKISLAGNRIKRLRRSCLVLNRLSGLKDVDIRENPVSLGFYAPRASSPTATNIGDREASSVKSRRGRCYDMPCGQMAAEQIDDEKWKTLMDETTAMKRRMVELLLAQSFGTKLKVLNGLPFDSGQFQAPAQDPASPMKDRVWDRLKGRGVLKKIDRNNDDVFL